MLPSFIILFAVTFLSGLGIYLLPKWKGEQFDFALIVSGAYLLGITVVHILPELFDQEESKELIGSMILLGFFVQILLEHLTSGVEHGHIHSHDHGQHHTMATSISMLVALCIHAFMEGTILAHPGTIHAQHDSNALLIGILLHKIPVAFALMSVLTCHFKTRLQPIIFLGIFALASPLGLLVNDQIAHRGLIDQSGVVILFAFVSGNFLKISTTIFFENNPEHKWNLRKIAISSLAAGLAVVAEIVF